jgi:hypothetical protein
MRPSTSSIQAVGTGKQEPIADTSTEMHVQQHLGLNAALAVTFPRRALQNMSPLVKGSATPCDRSDHLIPKSGWVASRRATACACLRYKPVVVDLVAI